jgi:hypothetical protein
MNSPKQRAPMTNLDPDTHMVNSVFDLTEEEMLEMAYDADDNCGPKSCDEEWNLRTSSYSYLCQH